MDLDANLIKEKIEEYRKDKNCAQSTLMGICEVAGLDIDDFPALAAGFGGGIGGTFDEGTCGAITGAVMALGFLADGKQGPCAKGLFDAFKEEYGSVTCGAITNNGEDKSLCTEVCVFAGQKVAELLKE